MGMQAEGEEKMTFAYLFVSIRTLEEKALETFFFLFFFFRFRIKSIGKG